MGVFCFSVLFTLEIIVWQNPTTQKNKCKCSVVYTPEWNSLLKFDWLDYCLLKR